VTTTAAVADLLRSMPGVDAPLVTRAAWFDRKAAVFDQLADAGGAEAAEARRVTLHARATAQLFPAGKGVRDRNGLSVQPEAPGRSGPARGPP
jgi:hypothetical protein